MDVAKLNAEIAADMRRRRFTRIPRGRNAGLYFKAERDDATRPGHVIGRMTDGLAYSIPRADLDV